MKAKPGSLLDAQLLAAETKSAPPGRRAFVWIFGLSMFMVGSWFFIGEPMLKPFAEAVRRHSAETRVKAYIPLIRVAADEAELPPELVAAIIFAESSGRVDAHSKADAYGLMQLRLPTAQEQARKLRLPEPTPTDLLTNPELNIRLGAHYFRWVLDHEESNLERSLVAYNAGRTRLKQWIEESGGTYEAWRATRELLGSSSTLAYAKKVATAQERFQKAGLFDVDPDNPSP